MDWWTYSAKSLAEAVIAKCLFVACTYCQLLMAKMTLTV